MDKTIEIPFGAYDSELGGWEYTIPEGLVAEIKDGKVVVKKAESEDERIRRGLIDMLKIAKSNGGRISISDEAADRDIAWLEKQKDKLEALRTEYEKGRADAIAEMKPSKWSEEEVDRMVKKRAGLSGTSRSEMEFYRHGIIDGVHHFCLQPHWKPSEEQMRMLSWAINYLSDIEQDCASTLALLKFDLKKLIED